MPRHKGFDPSRVKSLLPHLFVKEIPHDDDLHVRLRGEYLVKLLGPVHQGVNVYDRFEPGPKKIHIQFIKTVLETPVAGVLHRSPDTPEGLPYNFWTIALPFADEEGRVSFIIGCGQIDVIQTWPWQETVKMLGTALIHPPEYIDIGYGLPATN